MEGEEINKRMEKAGILVDLEGHWKVKTELDLLSQFPNGIPGSCFSMHGLTSPTVFNNVCHLLIEIPTI